LATAASLSAAGQRDSGASVSLDEENISLLSNQHAYQAAARVMTAVDEALDVLINRTGLVGR
jgi:flagellar hook-associated protein 1 FlgK